MPNPADALTDQFLGWIADGGRSYGEVMEAWRTSCPRLSIWEDALGDGLVRITNRPGGAREQARVTITERGRARLDEHTPARTMAAEPHRSRAVPVDA
jgi:hypothetical protein